jgi:hypothetical protein
VIGELVPSVSIANMVNQRAAVLDRLEKAIDLIREASDIAQAAHVGMPRVLVSNHYARGYGTEWDIASALLMPQRDGSAWGPGCSTRDEVLDAARKAVDGAAWQYLMHESGLRTFMDAKARADWDKQIAEGKVPELTDGNVAGTFQMLHDSRGELFERGVIDAFKSLSWDYKTNLPQKFGRRIVLRFIRGQMSGGKWGSTSLGHANYTTCDKLDDLERVFCVLDGKREPDHRRGWYSRMNAADKTTDPPIATDYISLRSFRNGNGHATFLRPELVDRMNLIIAKHYPGALPEPR